MLRQLLKNNKKKHMGLLLYSFYKNQERPLPPPCYSVRTVRRLILIPTALFSTQDERLPFFALSAPLGGADFDLAHKTSRPPGRPSLAASPPRARQRSHLRFLKTGKPGWTPSRLEWTGIPVDLLAGAHAATERDALPESFFHQHHAKERLRRRWCTNAPSRHTHTQKELLR